MATEEQTITFSYQQEGTSKGFNRLLYKVASVGIIDGLDLSVENNNTINISTGTFLIQDSENNVLINVSLNIPKDVKVSPSSPYVVAEFKWMDLFTNQVTFTAKDENSLLGSGHKDLIILGKGVFNGGNLEGIDGTLRNYSSIYWKKNAQYSTNICDNVPSFIVYLKNPSNGRSFNFGIGTGEAVICGKKIEITQERPFSLQIRDATQNNYFQPDVSYNRKDLLVIVPDNYSTDGYHFEYVMGDDSTDSEIPPFPSYGLTIATIELQNNIYSQGIPYNAIKYVYNDHFYSTNKGSTIGYDGESDSNDPHTLYI